MKAAAGRLALLAASVVATLAVLEAGCRLVRGRYYVLHWPNLVLDQREAAERYYRTVMSPDARLGFVPRPGHEGPTFSHDSDGLRRTPAEAGIGPRPLLLAVGDSFAYGAEVGDAGTWPSRLQDAVRTRVANGGVAAYGLDQAVLRAEALTQALQPEAILLSFIADDLRRAELSRFLGFEKPYLVPSGDRLAAANVPVPSAPSARDSLSFWERLLGWSVLFDTVARRLDAAEDWPYDSVRVLPPGTGERMACPLMARLAELSRPVLVIAQYDPSAWESAEGEQAQRRMTAVVLECAARAGLATLDTFDVVTRAAGPQGTAALFGPEGHYNARGNAVIADAIAARLAALGWVSPKP
ncbi:hypothetical protein [Reyranella sp.]|uniref:hypothetical protein n=1 Tax=Reyranella sp. TaxID=1929291 RepID=UPI003BAD3508